MKELRLLRPLLVSAPLPSPPPNISSSLHTTPRPSPCHASDLPCPTHSPPPTSARTPKASNFLRSPSQPLASSQAILLLHSFDALVSPVLKPAPLYLYSMRLTEKKPVQASCSTEQKVIGQGVVSITQRLGGKRVKTEGSLCYLFLCPLRIGILTLLRLRQVGGGGCLLKLLVQPSCRYYKKPQLSIFEGAREREAEASFSLCRSYPCLFSIYELTLPRL